MSTKTENIRINVTEATLKNTLLNIVKHHPKCEIVAKKAEWHELMKKGFCRNYFYALTLNDGTCMRSYDGVLVRTRVEYIVYPFASEKTDTDLVVVQIFETGDIIYQRPFKPEETIILSYIPKAYHNEVDDENQTKIFEPKTKGENNE